MEGFGKQADGELDFPEKLTRREWRTLKQVSGVRPLELRAALAALDQDVLIAFSMIGLERAGRPVMEDVFLDASGDARIVLVDEPADEKGDEAGGPAIPPASPAPTGPESSAGGAGKPSETTSPGGSGTSDDSDIQETTLRAVGGLS